MPTNRKRRTRVMMPTITEAMRNYLETGSFDGAYPEEDRCDTFLLSNRDDELKTIWDANKDTIMGDWMKTHPGSKPYAWWRFENDDTSD